ncbi:glycosyltransferase family 39 protein [Clostridium sp. 'White wine YQ']|uniref:glycosyltransferase family 39 protein n=1 Tax=Clostridium sp. 'White wine YQ' TaxID=3027474 RepID=UPI0023670C15|nr:glycosyltransferase family 39 protein [Clostridium sp. 'White wine YQ']MDD7796164.1 glycosyltransferase family 39 protein [Clostridium sp. 'White wine YQ']
MKKLKLTKENIALTIILIISAVLNFTNLNIEGYANEYYAAGVKSMTMSLKNFFFVSFDPAGFVSIDKPPLGFMIQAISAKIFGFSGFSILLPEALAGVISVGLIYHIVKRSFGSIAGLISALCLAVTPIFVADSRNNTIDNLLIVALLLACLALSKAAEKGKLKYLILSLVFVGIGFNIKMLQAYMIVPALYITYLLSSAASIKKRIAHLALGTVVLLITSLSWAFIVGLVPASDRPFVGSSTNNTVMELIVGHNGLERLGLSSSSNRGGGNFGGGMGQGNRQGTDGNTSNVDGQNTNNGQPSQGAPDANSGATQAQNNAQGNSQDGGNAPSGAPSGIQGNPPSGGMGPGGNFGGRMGQNANGQTGNMGGSEGAGITRLFSNNSLSDQIIWLLPLAVIGFIAAAIKEKLRLSLKNEKQIGIVLWAAWLVPVFTYFSFTTGLFHPYYLTMLAPPIAALVGIGITSMWELYKQGGWKSWLLPASFIINAGVQLLILSYYYNSSSIPKFIMIAITILSIASSIALGIFNLIKKKKDDIDDKTSKITKGLITTALVGLLIAPAIWSGTTMFYKMAGTFPSAGLSLMTGSGGMDGRGMGGSFGSSSGTDSSTQKLVNYLKANTTTEKYLVAVQSSNGTAASIIIQTGGSVMTLGGFSGSDKILTLDEFKNLVSEGQIRYVLTGGQGGGGNNEIMNWVKENGTLVPQSEWSNSQSQNSETGTSNTDDGNVKNSRNGMSNELYDLKAK